MRVLCFFQTWNTGDGCVLVVGLGVVLQVGRFHVAHLVGVLRFEFLVLVVGQYSPQAVVVVCKFARV